jgi:oligopeptide/dipeptide ABC transporter ATP-binding protein
MYTGKIVEYGSVDELFSRPLHPYTVGLMNSIPKIGGDSGQGHLRTIAGTVPNLYELPVSCSFRDRCPDAMAVCSEQKPELIERSPGHFVRCFKYV